MQTTEERVKALDERLYGGSVKSPREMQSSITELESAKEEILQMEEQLLDLMVKLDKSEDTLEKSTKQLSVMETDREKLLVNLEMERKILLAEIQTLTEKREKSVVDIEANQLVLYERIRTARKGSAIARVESGMCQGCHLKLTTRQMQQLRSSDDLVQCNSCTRIFYLS